MKCLFELLLICTLIVSCNSNEYKNDKPISENGERISQQESNLPKAGYSTSTELNQDKHDEVNNLQSAEEKEIYLTGLFERYERTNPDFAQGVAIKYGLHSDKYKQKISELKDEKELIFSIIKQYLEIHGFPSEIGSFNWKAKTIIQNVVKDRRNYDDQNDVLQLLIKNHSIASNNLLGMSLVLPEMYKSKNNGRNYEYTSRSLSLKQVVQEISKELGIETIKD